MNAEIHMCSPLPRKVRSSLPTSPLSPFYGGDVDDMQAELSIARPFWYDNDVNDQATQDLRDVLCFETPTKALPDWLPAFESRCLSSASTCATSACATSPPPPSCFSPPLSPDPVFAVVREDCDEMESPTAPPQCPPGALDKSSWLQARKVFVGGIPQTIDQNALYHMFSRIGKVKKAWLQLFHADRGVGMVPSEKKHRGFGFVIFYEKHILDQMLGDTFSRFISFPDGLKFEVKRATGKINGVTADEQQSSGWNKEFESVPRQTSQRALPTGLLTPQSQSMATPDRQQSFGPSKESECCGGLTSPQPPASQTSTSWQSPSPPASWQQFSPSPPPSWQSLSPSPPPPQSWQNGPNQVVLVGVPYVNMPMIPAFPFVHAAPVQNAVQWPARGSTPNAILEGLLGQQTLNNQELTQALLEALPEHYDD